MVSETNFLSHAIEKNIDLNRENAILLNKLVDISQGKWSSVHGPSTFKK